MDDDIVLIELVDRAGARIPATVTLGCDERMVDGFDPSEFVVTVRWAGGEQKGRGFDAFVALAAVREQLEPLGLRPACYGACRNLVVSGMASQMGGGVKGYLVSLGRPSRTADLVGIFDSDPSVEPVSVADQDEFREAWMRSLGSGPHS